MTFLFHYINVGHTNENVTCRIKQCDTTKTSARSITTVIADAAAAAALMYAATVCLRDPYLMRSFFTRRLQAARSAINKSSRVSYICTTCPRRIMRRCRSHLAACWPTATVHQSRCIQHRRRHSLSHRPALLCATMDSVDAILMHKKAKTNTSAVA